MPPGKPTRPIDVRLSHPLFRGVLRLGRTPLYLRFTHKADEPNSSRNWDALDQLDDVPEAGETIIAARLVERGSLHLDRVVNGRKVGEWYATADYTPLDNQPPDDVLRDREQWQAWCQTLHAAETVH